MSGQTSTLTSKGQITVPVETRRRLGLKPGDRVEFVVDRDKTVIRPARAEGNPFARYAGALPAFESVEEINAWVREIRDDEEFPL
jgi:antitoxin PrlF